MSKPTAFASSPCHSDGPIHETNARLGNWLSNTVPSIKSAGLLLHELICLFVAGQSSLSTKHPTLKPSKLNAVRYKTLVDLDNGMYCQGQLVCGSLCHDSADQTIDCDSSFAIYQPLCPSRAHEVAIAPQDAETCRADIETIVELQLLPSETQSLFGANLRIRPSSRHSHAWPESPWNAAMSLWIRRIPLIAECRLVMVHFDEFFIPMIGSARLVIIHCRTLHAMLNL